METININSRDYIAADCGDGDGYGCGYGFRLSPTAAAGL